MENQKLLAITGPSCSGKTKLAVELAKELNGEIISVDSRQIYKELDIGSAKPDMKERDNVPHHLIDIVDVTQDYNVANFCDDAKQLINDIISRNKFPILAGGTGLYFRVLLQDFDLPRVVPDKELRQKLGEKSSQELYNMLLNLDYETAQKIHYNNKVKIIRALEVYMKSGIPMSLAQKKKDSGYNILWCGLNSHDRDFLYSRINERSDFMIESGLLNEVKKLFDKYDENKILLNTIGYQEFYPFFKGEITLDEAISKFKQDTRRYAKRQISWFNSNKDINWYDIKIFKMDEIKKSILKKYSEF